MTPEQRDAINAVRAAIVNPGSHPTHHDLTLARHRAQWPTLWKALDRLMEVT